MGKTHFFRTILVVFLFPAALWGQEAASPRSIADLQELLLRGAYAKAAAEAIEAVESGLPPDTLVEYHLLAGRAYLEMDSLVAAQIQFQAALGLSRGAGRTHVLHRAEALSGLGDCAIRRGAVQKALEFQRQALQLCEETTGKLSEETAASCHALGNAWRSAGDLPQAFRYLIRALDIRQAILPQDHPDLAESWDDLGICVLAQGKTEDAIQYFQQALDLRKEVLGEAHPKTGLTHLHLGRAHYQAGLYEGALASYQTALDIQKQLHGDGDPSLAFVYDEMGNVLLAQYASREAERNFRLAADLLKADQQAVRAALLHKIGLCLEARGEDAEALVFHQNALDAMERLYGNQHPALAPVLRHIGSAYMQREDFSGALPFLQRAIGIFKTTYPQGHPDLVETLNLKAVCYVRLEQPQEALAILRQAEAMLGAARAYTLQGKAHTIKNQALAFFELGKHAEALSLVRTALGLLWPDRNLNRVNRVLAPEIVSLLVLESRLMPRTGSRYADAAGLLETALQLSSRLRLIQSDEGRREWLASAADLFAEAVETNFLAWKFTGKPAFLKRAFQLSEQYKGLILVEAVRHAQPPRFKGISARLLAQKREVETTLFQIENQHWTAVQREQSEREAALNQQIAQQRQQLDRVRKSLQAESPDYDRLFEGSKNIRISNMQQTLDSDQALLEYFVSDSVIFLFVLTQDTLHGFRLPKKFALDAMVKDFRALIRAYPGLSGDAVGAQAGQWSRLSNELYRRLLSTALEQMQLPSRLIIVPDGILHFLPFEALLTKMPNDVIRFKTHEYLLNSYSISYCYSAALLEEQKVIVPRGRFWGKYLLSMAPDYNNNSFGLPALPRNIQESEALRKLFGGRMLLGSDATLYNFLSLAPQFRVLHLPAHCNPAPENGQSAYVAFAERKDEKDNEFLYASELYNLRLRADLAVLSGQDTGSGSPAEGLLGMHRGFFYAGVKSLMSTLWNVQSTQFSSIVQRCFFYLRKGLPKDVALQRAKLDFLDQHPHLKAHPYYWSGLLLAGDTVSLPDPRLKWLISWLLAIAGLGLAVFLYWKWIRKPNGQG